jgi:hypothetical protein
MGVTARFLDAEGLGFRSPLGPALFLLSRRAARWIDTLDLTSHLLIPSLVPHETPGQLAMLAYRWVLAPCLEFGLVEERGGLKALEPVSVRVTALFAELITFRFVDPDGRPQLRLVR